MKRAPHLPKISDLAWHGPVGRAVQEIAPHTEADPVAVLASALALFGALVGDVPFVRVGSVRHPPRVWPLIVGKTGAGRKGTSYAEARGLMRRLGGYAEAYMDHRVVSGLSSGEGLLAALGAAPAGGKDGRDSEAAHAEPIAPDGRLTVLETEFARVLAAAKREGNTLGPILRQLWDEGSAAILTRQAPLTVTGAHLTVIAHVTPGELRLRLAESDLVGGTVNRYLLIASERPHLLPYETTRPELAPLAAILRESADHARAGIREVHRDRAANALWRDVYGALSANEPDGQLGAVLARGPAYTMRLALVYALADGSGAICVDHLLAALAVWHYASETAKLLFADARRRSDLERLAEYIADAKYRTGNDIYNFFGRNKTREEIKEMLDDLEGRGDVGSEAVRTGGRPETRWWWTGAPRDAVAELLDQHRYDTSPS